jgi:protoporphyrinogen oxidase
MKDVIVIGGGIAGIAAARAHIDKGAKVHLIERSSRLGGVLESTDVDGVPRNHSAQTIALTQDLAQRFKHWGVFALLKPAPDLANTRCIVFNGKVHRSRTHFMCSRVDFFRSARRSRLWRVCIDPFLMVIQRLLTWPGTMLMTKW